MFKIYIPLLLLLTFISGCSEKTLTMPENKILKEEYNLNYNSQDFSLFVKSFSKDTINAVVNAYIEKYKPGTLSMLRFKIYDTELPLDLINKINEPMKTDSLGNALITFPPKGVKSVECWYWYKTGDKDMSDIHIQK